MSEVPGAPDYAAAMIWRTRRQAREAKILAALADGGYHHGLDICRAAGLPTGSIHPDLARLERQGRIGSRRLNDRRVYWLR